MKNCIPVFDGAMGTMLQRAGMPMGMSTEQFGLEHPEIVTQVHTQYVKAGAQFITANTFQANLGKLGSVQTVEHAVRTGVENARKSGAEFVSLDVGPLGTMMEPMGTLDLAQAVEQFGTQMAAGEAAGADCILVETMSDLYEVKAAVLAAREYTKLPVLCTLSFQENGRTFLGCDAASAAVILSALGVDALGANCSLGPRDLLPVVNELVKYASVPVLVQPNAGLPRMVDDVAHYDVTPAEFTGAVADMVQSGASIVGGCCGTTPQHIEALCRAVRELPVSQPKGTPADWITAGNSLVSFTQCTQLSFVLDATQNPQMSRWLREDDMDSIAEEAIDAVDDYNLLCVNVDVPDIDSAALMPRAVRAAQSMAQIPLLLCSDDPAVLEAGARVARGRPAVRLLGSSQPERMEQIAKRYGAFVVE